MKSLSKRRNKWLRKARRWLSESSQNAVEIARLGRLAPAQSLGFEVVDATRVCRLRRYHGTGGHRQGSAPLLLVPPLMLTAEIYDVAPELSAVRLLQRSGIDTWVVDFGAPEREEGGMSRTLDDHVRAVAWAVERVRQLSGQDVHLAGYSQGGMFAYQAAAYLQSEGLASLITFGSPVDIHKNVPNLASDLVSRWLKVVKPLIDLPLARIEGLPGILTSTSFKLMTPRKELEQLWDFILKLNDREALKKRESRRRFLGGEGFVAWPAPALRTFVDQVIVQNRMLSGGIVIDNRTVTLADIRCPILYFVGSRDDFARPASVRAICAAAPFAEHHEVTLSAGHFGLVVGSTSLRRTWPSVIQWLKWREGSGPEPDALRQTPASVRHGDEPEDFFEVDFELDVLGSEMGHLLRRSWGRVGDILRDWGDSVDHVRWQLPRLAKLERMSGETRVSPSLILAQRAAEQASKTFFLWQGRAFSYGEANRRVERVVRGLIACGIRPGDRVAVAMATRPSLLSLVTALGRLGAVPVLLDPEAVAMPGARQIWKRLDASLPLAAAVTEPENAAAVQANFTGKVLVLGGGSLRTVPAGVVDMEQIDSTNVELPSWYRPDQGLARELAFIFVSPKRDGDFRMARVTNGRWAFSALGVASAATLTPADTVYSCLPMYHPTGLLVSVGGALVGEARLALAERFDASRFWRDIRRTGSTVVFYAGDMLRGLLNAQVERSDRRHPVRLFAGSGMRTDVWRRLVERFGAGVIEFYASTERNLVLANASGKKVGALGRALPGSVDLAIASYDFEERRLKRREDGHSGQRFLVPAAVGEAGLALVRLGSQMDVPGAMEHVFERGDRWLLGRDILRCDADGDYWFVDRLDDAIVAAGELVASRDVEDGLHALPEFEAVGVYPSKDGRAMEAVVQSSQPFDLSRVNARLLDALAPQQLPLKIHRLLQLPMSAGFRCIKEDLRVEAEAAALETLSWDATRGKYRCELDAADPSAVAAASDHSSTD